MDPHTLQQITEQQHDRILLERAQWAAAQERVASRRRDAAARAQMLRDSKHEALVANVADDDWRTQRVLEQHETRRLEAMAHNRVAQQHATELVTLTKAQRAARQQMLHDESVMKVETAAQKAAAATQMRAVSAAASTRLSQQHARERRQQVEVNREAKRLLLAEQEQQRLRDSAREAHRAGAARRSATQAHLAIAQRVHVQGRMQLEHRRDDLEAKIEQERVHAEAVAVMKERDLEAKRQEKRQRWDLARERARMAMEQRQIRREQIAAHFDATLSVGEMRAAQNRLVPRVASLMYDPASHSPPPQQENQQPI